MGNDSTPFGILDPGTYNALTAGGRRLFILASVSCNKVGSNVRRATKLDARISQYWRAISDGFIRLTRHPHLWTFGIVMQSWVIQCSLISNHIKTRKLERALESYRRVYHNRCKGKRAANLSRSHLQVRRRDGHERPKVVRPLLGLAELSQTRGEGEAKLFLKGRVRTNNDQHIVFQKVMTVRGDK